MCLFSFMLRTAESFYEFCSDIGPKAQYLQTTNYVKKLTEWLAALRSFLFLRILFHSLIPNKAELNSGSLVVKNLSWRQILESTSLVYRPWAIYVFLLMSPDIFLLRNFHNYAILCIYTFIWNSLHSKSCYQIPVC